MKLTFKQIIAKLSNHYGVYEIFYNDSVNITLSINDIKIGEIYKQLEYCWENGETVVYVIDHDVYMSIPYYYDSYIGEQLGDWEDVREVKPELVTTLTYKEIEND